MSVMIIVAYLLVGGHWRVDHAMQSVPTQSLLCKDHVARLQARATERATRHKKFEVFCQALPKDV